MVDPDGKAINLYIVAKQSPEMYCYRHVGSIETLPTSIRELLDPRGVVLGTIELGDMVSKLVDVKKAIDQSRIKFIGGDPNKIFDDGAEIGRGQSSTIRGINK
jgi:hypothetical protein